jgi:CRAL/TRIO domain
MMDANLPTAAEAVAARRLRAQALTEGLELSDFEYCQFAIVSKCHPGKALARVRRMRALQREFATDEVDEDAIMSYIAESVPGFVQSIGWDAGERGVLIVDFAAFDPTALDSEGAWQLHVASCIAVLDAVAGINLRTIRAGTILAADCKGSGWRNFSHTTQASYIRVYQNCYPTTIAALAVVDAPAVMGFMIGLCKALLAEKLRRKIRSTSRSEFAAAVSLPSSTLPPPFGGSFTQEELVRCMRDRLAERRRAMDTVKI